MFWTVVGAFVLATGYAGAISVQCPKKRYITILFQPVTLNCNFQTTASQPPVVTWKYKSYCRDPIQAALNPNSAENILSQNNPNYDPNIECADSLRTIRIVASKQANAVTLGKEFQGRKISIINNADLNIGQTAWGDSGVYVCSVVSAQDLSGNSEDYTELIVLERKSNTTDLLPGIDLLVMEDWLLVVLVVFGFLLLILLVGICWCQCCPHTCCCYVSCPCCPNRCCCPRALYEAGKAVKKGIPSQYAPTLYPPSMYSQPGYIQPSIPMLPLPGSQQNGYGREFDGASSVGHGSQVPLLRDSDIGADHTRSGYRIQVDPDGNATRAIYYMEKELANMDPTRTKNYNRTCPSTPTGGEETTARGEAGATWRRGVAPAPWTTWTIWAAAIPVTTTTHPEDAEDRDDGRRRRDRSPEDRGRGGASDAGRDMQGRRSRSRDDLMDMERGGRGYDDRFLREAMEKKRLGEQQRARSRERLDDDRAPPPLPISAPSAYPGRRDDFPPPLPPPYSDEESLSSSKKTNLRKNGAVSRESLVV
ncbi:hypothetical protein NHX12_001958 [Muraenolepis orangiensis]|uniref:Ig-like domain-containing protein n=1 Tax=Muraenolepis orangiensis TaxID=630683 RepID=A0A9Q0E1X2_9TELE|nr:hypothetical protein NHX12_001958 [Muraenolepis orangiensis]